MKSSALIGASAIVAALVLASACGGNSQVTRKGDDDGRGGDTATGGSDSGGTSSSGSGGGGGAVSFGGSSGSGAGTGMGGEGGGCGKTDLAAEPARANVLVVVDKSSSMSGTPAGFSEDKWSALGSALGEALDAARDSVAFGLDFYPFGDDRDPMAPVGTCDMPSSAEILVPIGPGATTVPLIDDALADYEPAGGTPTAAALARALDYFTTGDGALLEGDRYVLLATDGGPNCNPDLECEIEACTLNMDGLNCGGQNCCDARLDPDGPSSCLDDEGAVGAVAALAEAGVRTFVVGIPGTAAYGATLDAMAVAGLEENPDGPARYFRVESMGGTTGLVEVLTRITRGVIRSCRLKLDSTPDDPDYEGLLNVEIDGADVPQAGDDGWVVDRTTEPPTIVLKGATCAAIEADGAERVTITYGCPTVRDPH
ncbi:MAG TPA: vWA domain-containing protein [Polyangiaceae bacterium]